MALSSLEKLHNSSKFQPYNLQNVDNDTLQGSNDTISIKCLTQCFVQGWKKPGVVTVMVMVEVVGGDTGGSEDSGGG